MELMESLSMESMHLDELNKKWPHAVIHENHEGTLEITIRAASRDGKSGAELVIADTGPGIRAETLNTVFDPFYTTKQGEGTGLGLSVSQTLIQAANGLISVQNRAGGGAAFSVWLPGQTDEAKT